MSTATFDSRHRLPATTVTAPELRGAVSRIRRAATAGGDVLLLGGIIVGLPFVILAIGIPIALLVQLLLWIIRLF